MLNTRSAEFTEAAALFATPSPEPPTLVKTILQISAAKPGPVFLWAGVALYFGAVFALVTFDFSSEPITLEAPVEMVYEEAAAEPEPAQPEPPPPVAETPPEPPPPPPPVAEAPPEPPPPPPPVVEEAAEPVVEPPPPPPPPPKVEPEPPKVEAPPREKPVVKKPKAGPATTAHTPGATVSSYAPKVYARISGVAANTSGSGKKSVRVSYSLVIGASGQLISVSVNPSGVPSADKIAAGILRRSAPFPPPGLGGGTFRINGGISVPY